MIGGWRRVLLDPQHSRPRSDGQAEFYLGKVDMPGNLGTYLDSPSDETIDAR